MMKDDENEVIPGKTLTDWMRVSKVQFDTSVSLPSAPKQPEELDIRPIQCSILYVCAESFIIRPFFYQLEAPYRHDEGATSVANPLIFVKNAFCWLWLEMLAWRAVFSVKRVVFLCRSNV
jgi:hypothetical protein